MGHRWIITTVGQYMLDHPGRVVMLDELVRETQFREPQIVAALNKWRSNRPEVRDRLRVVLPGKAWEYTNEPTTASAPLRVGSPEHQASERKTVAAMANADTLAEREDPNLWREEAAEALPETFEPIGRSRGGTIILRDNTGTLYTAKEM